MKNNAQNIASKNAASVYSMNHTKLLKITSWALVAVVLFCALAVWGSERLGSKDVTVYAIFPLLGLGAFSIMWTHFITGSIRRYLSVAIKENKTYLKYTSWLVLVLLLLHPGLLIYQLNNDGFGLPPQSYLTVYAEPAMKTALMLGTISLLIFHAFELRKKFYKKQWWQWVNRAQVLAMGFIFYHGLTLGRELSVPWYRALWFFYGVSLVAAVTYNYWYDRSSNKKGTI